MSQPVPQLLLVDDEANIVHALQRLVRQHFGNRVLCRATISPQQALAWAKTRRFDAVVSDLRMPAMDGLALLGQVAALQPHAALMMLTGSADFTSAQMAVNQVGAFRYLTKPWCDSELLQHLEAGLQHGAQARARAADAQAFALSSGRISAQDIERQRLEALEPGITDVAWGPQGEVLLEIK